jgi:hypothetical protein
MHFNEIHACTMMMASCGLFQSTLLKLFRHACLLMDEQVGISPHDQDKFTASLVPSPSSFTHEERRILGGAGYED